MLPVYVNHVELRCRCGPLTSNEGVYPSQVPDMTYPLIFSRVSFEVRTCQPIHRTEAGVTIFEARLWTFVGVVTAIIVSRW